jgi:hypothetical protein
LKPESRIAMSEPLECELARNPVIATKAPGGDGGAGRKGSRHRPAWGKAVRHLEPGPTSRRAEVVPSSAAGLRSAATLGRLWGCSL